MINNMDIKAEEDILTNAALHMQREASHMVTDLISNHKIKSSLICHHSGISYDDLHLLRQNKLITPLNEWAYSAIHIMWAKVLSGMPIEEV